MKNSHSLGEIRRGIAFGIMTVVAFFFLPLMGAHVFSSWGIQGLILVILTSYVVIILLSSDIWQDEGN